MRIRDFHYCEDTGEQSIRVSLRIKPTRSEAGAGHPNDLTPAISFLVPITRKDESDNIARPSSPSDFSQCNKLTRSPRAAAEAAAVVIQPRAFRRRPLTQRPIMARLLVMSIMSTIRGGASIPCTIAAQ